MKASYIVLKAEYITINLWIRLLSWDQPISDTTNATENKRNTATTLPIFLFFRMKGKAQLFLPIFYFKDLDSTYLNKNQFRHTHWSKLLNFETLDILKMDKIESVFINLDHAGLR